MFLTSASGMFFLYHFAHMFGLVSSEEEGPGSVVQVVLNSGDGIFW